MERPKYNQAIIDRINGMEEGTIFITSDFSDIATVPAINMSMTRLIDENKIKRIMRGVYEKPRYSNLLKEFVATDTEKVAYAIARNHNWSIAPAGDTALNLLKLSTQVPVVCLYVSDGPYKEYEYEDIRIKFNHTSHKETSGLTYITALTIQAIRAIGKEKISEREVDILKSVLTDSDKRIIIAEAQGTTAWIYSIIKKLT